MGGLGIHGFMVLCSVLFMNEDKFFASLFSLKHVAEW